MESLRGPPSPELPGALRSCANQDITDYLHRVTTERSAERRRGRAICRGLALGVPAAVVIALCAVLLGQGGSTEPGRASTTPVLVAPPSQVASLWVGDSFTAGAGAVRPRQGEACLTAKMMGWLCTLDAQAGTGFLNEGKAGDPSFVPIEGRLRHTKEQFVADVIVVDGGRNDLTAPAGALELAMSSYFTALRTAWPDAEVVIIAPYFMRGEGVPVVGLTAFMAAEAARIDASFIDPIGEGWVSEKTATMTADDRLHPSPEGHAYLAKHLAARLRELGLSTVPVTDLRAGRRN